jgi:hypothetical protein
MPNIVTRNGLRRHYSTGVAHKLRADRVFNGYIDADARFH